LGTTALLGAIAQKGPGPAAPQRRSYYAISEIHVDQDCRILPDAAYTRPGKKPKPYTDENICHLENVNSVERVEEKVAGHQLLRNRVEIQEQEFVLWNPSDEPATFVVEQAVPKDWVIDSDPRPKQVLGQTAYFPVQVQAGETVRLHVGLRHTSPLRARNIAAQAARAANSALASRL
jgi:hypothetical protein